MERDGAFTRAFSRLAFDGCYGRADDARSGRRRRFRDDGQKIPRRLAFGRGCADVYGPWFDGSGLQGSRVT